MTSPMHNHSRSTSTSLSMKKPQNRAAAQRLAQVMAQQPADDEEEEDELYDFNSSVASTGIGLAGSGRNARSRSPMTVRNSVDQASSSRTTPSVRSSEPQQPSSARHHRPVDPSSAVATMEQPSSARYRPQPKPVEPSSSVASAEQQQPSSARYRPQPKPVEPSSSVASAEQQQPSSARYRHARSKPLEPSSNVVEEQQPSSARHRSCSTSRNEPSQTVASVEQQQPSSARHRHTQSKPAEQSEEAQSQPQPSSARSAVGRSSSSISNMEQPSSARVVGRPHLRVKTPSMALVPSSVPLSLKPVASGTTADTQTDKARDKKLSFDFGTFNYKDSGGQQSSSALQDELDMLQEENESLLEKLRIAEERYDEAEARTRQLERQIESLGEGVSLEARLISRKEADLQKREVALKVAAETYGGSSEELAILRMEIEAARDEATTALDQLHDAKQEVKSLRITTQRMILTHEEMEEVVLKRCWLARCWSLCVRHGIHADIAEARHEYWSHFASRPVEVILAAGRKAKDAKYSHMDGFEERERVLKEKETITKKVDVESMLMVEKGLRELSSLKVEEAIAIAMAQKRRPVIVRSNMDEVKLPGESNNYSETFGLSPEESEDVLLKQAWLSYFWRRAKTQGLEPDIAEDRLQFWINQGNRIPNSHDAVDVERGLLELRKLGIEAKLWEESRRLIDPDSSQKTLLETEYQILS